MSQATVRIRVLEGDREGEEFIVNAMGPVPSKFEPFEVIEGRAFFADSPELAADVLDDASVFDREIDDADEDAAIEDEDEAEALAAFESEGGAVEAIEDFDSAEDFDAYIDDGGRTATPDEEDEIDEILADEDE